MRTTSLFAARSMSIELIPALFSFSFSSLRSFTSSCRRSAYSLSAYHRDLNGLLYPSRNPYGCVFCPTLGLLTSCAAVKRPTTSCPFSRALAAFRSRPCERGARCRARPFALPPPPHWLPRVPRPPRDARPRPPKGARCASDSETPAPSARDAAVSSAALHSQNIALQTACPHPAAHRSLLPCAPHWRSRCAALFRCA